MGLLLALCAGIPLATAILLMLFRSAIPTGTARWIAATGAVATCVAALGLVHGQRQLRGEHAATAVAATDGSATVPRPMVEWRRDWLSVATDDGSRRIGFEMRFGLDGIGVVMIVLSALLTFSAALISWESIREREPEFYAALMLLEAGLVGVFCAWDVALFYVFFEMTLIPLFFLIALWGGAQRRHAALKFFMYTLAGSVITLVGLATLIWQACAAGLTSPTSIPDLAAWLQRHPLPIALETTIFLAIAAGFLVKVPVFPFHTWLPLAHVEAPTAGSVLLAGVLLKLGTYGFLRLLLPLFPAACLSVGLPVLGVLSVVGIVYGSQCALAQRDIKRLVAYSSVAHLGFCMLGLFALNVEGLTGGVLQMINHGLSTGALFLLVGMIYDRYHTRQIDDLGGLAARLPLIACCMVFVTMSSIGLPGLNGFTGEVLSLAGMFKQHPLYAILGATGVVLGAWYMLTMLQHVFFGTTKEPDSHGEPIGDLSFREALALGPLMALCLWIGVRPGPLLELIEPDVKTIAALYDAGSPTRTADVESHGQELTSSRSPKREIPNPKQIRMTEIPRF